MITKNLHSLPDADHLDDYQRNLLHDALVDAGRDQDAAVLETSLPQNADLRWLGQKLVLGTVTARVIDGEVPPPLAPAGHWVGGTLRLWVPTGSGINILDVAVRKTRDESSGGSPGDWTGDNPFGGGEGQPTVNLDDEGDDGQVISVVDFEGEVHAIYGGMPLRPSGEADDLRDEIEEIVQDAFDDWEPEDASDQEIYDAIVASGNCATMSGVNRTYPMIEVERDGDEESDEEPEEEPDYDNPIDEEVWARVYMGRHFDEWYFVCEDSVSGLDKTLDDNYNINVREWAISFVQSHVEELYGNEIDDFEEEWLRATDNA